MIRLSALNYDSSDDSEPEPTQESIKQAKENESLDLYNKALELQQKGDNKKAEEAYKRLLASSLIAEAPPPGEEGLTQPGQVLKYSAYKNLAVLAEARGDINTATDCYLEAVQLDDSDVTVWFHVGQVAMKSFDLCLARQAFEQGLQCNPKHWPCVDSLCTVLYSIGDYVACLYLIAKALERDEEYLKGLALRDKIFEEEAYHKRDFQNFRSLFTSTLAADIDKEKSSQLVSDALTLREQRFLLAKLPELPPVIPVKQLVLPTWSCLGECFIAIYDCLTAPSNSQPLGSRVDLESYYKAIIAPDMSSSYRSSAAKSSDYSSSASFSTEGFGLYNSTQTSETDDKSKKGTKRKKQWQAPSALDAEFPPKRRSARVRTNKKKQEEVNYQEIVLSFLPSSLLKQPFVGDDESSQDSTAGESSQASQRLGGQEQRPSDEAFLKAQREPYEEVIAGEAETLDVLTFVKEHMKNGGIIELMNQYGICLAYQSHKRWPSGLADVFLKVYTRMRKHVVLPSEFICDQDEKYRTGMARLILVATELNLDKLQTAKSKSSSSLSPASSPRGGTTGVSPIRVAPGLSNKYLATDVEYLHNIACDRSFHGDFWLVNAIRVNWSKARYLMLQGQMDHAMIHLERCTKLLAVKVSPLAEPITVKLVNCRVDNVIALEQVEKKLESLQRCQSLEEVHRLYDVGHYEDVVRLLKGTLYQPQPKTRVSELGMSIPERPAQLLLLLDSLIKLKDFKQCLTCGEVSLNEATSQMIPCEAWSTTLSRMFTSINCCMSQGKEVLDSLPKDKLQRMTQNLIKVIEASMYAPENSTEPPLATAMPWVILYKIIQHEELEEPEMERPTSRATTPVRATSASPSPLPDSTVNTDSNLDNVSVSSDIPNLPRSLQFLHTAHDHLGGRGWCCSNDGAFLLQYVGVLTEELAKPYPLAKEELVRDLEQCFLCLYGHPSKKAKVSLSLSGAHRADSSKVQARGLQEHNSTQIPLTWSNSAVVFDYFKPKELPTFDSANKTDTITNEVQNLMRRITEVVPQQELEAIKFEKVQTFIDGTLDDVPKLPTSLVGKKRPVVTELFYLLADFYFKNKEFSKALKFYMHDICVMPDRADSWAAMALAHKSRLESKLNACEPKSMGPMQKHAVSALRCFKRALEVDSSNCSLWEEYGTLSYVLHSHASRQLRQLDEEEMSAETRLLWTKRHEEMLLQSEQCFKSALDKEDGDSWLHYYMLGKIAEKLNKPLDVYLEHFQQAAKELDEEGAEYPKKIAFYNPPDLALEALEVYFRLHASIIKALFNAFPDVDTSLLQEHIRRAAKGPFYHQELDVEYHNNRTDSTSLETSANSNGTKAGTTLNEEDAVRSNMGSFSATMAAQTGSVTELLEKRPTSHVDVPISDTSMDFDTKPVSGVSSPTHEPYTNPEVNIGSQPSTPSDGGFKVPEVKYKYSEPTLKDTDDKLAVPDVQLDVQDVEMKEESEETGLSETKNVDNKTESTSVDSKEQVSLSSTQPTGFQESANLVTNTRPQEEISAFKTHDVKQSDCSELSQEIMSMVDVFDQNRVEVEELGKEKPPSEFKKPHEPEKGDLCAVQRNTGGRNVAEDITEKSSILENVKTVSKAVAKIIQSTENIPMTVHDSRDIPQTSDVSGIQDTLVTKFSGKSGEASNSTKSVDETCPEDAVVKMDVSETVPEKMEEHTSESLDKANQKDDTTVFARKSNVSETTEAQTVVTEADLVQKSSDSTVSAEDLKSPGEDLKSPVGSDSVKSPTEIIATPKKKEPTPLTPEQRKVKAGLLDCCIRALEYCLRRFPQHHKSRYRLAYIYFYSDTHKDAYLSRDLLLGSNTRKKKEIPFPHQCLLNEKAKTNLFSAFWRIPEEDIDRPGSFCTHTYKSVELLLKVLTKFKEWDSLLQVSNVLYRTPEPGKKYLRDNERSCLARKAFDMSLQIIKERIAKHDLKDDVAVLQQLVLDVYEIWKAGQKYQSYIEMTEKLLEETFVTLQSGKVKVLESTDTTDTQGSVLEQALKYCQQYTKPQPSVPSTPVSQSSHGSTSSGAGTPTEDTPKPPEVSQKLYSDTDKTGVPSSRDCTTFGSAVITSPTVTKNPDESTTRAVSSPQSSGQELGDKAISIGVTDVDRNGKSKEDCARAGDALVATVSDIRQAVTASTDGANELGAAEPDVAPVAHLCFEGGSPAPSDVSAGIESTADSHQR